MPGIVQSPACGNSLSYGPALPWAGRPRAIFRWLHTKETGSPPGCGILRNPRAARVFPLRETLGPHSDCVARQNRSDQGCGAAPAKSRRMGVSSSMDLLQIRCRWCTRAAAMVVK